MGGLWDGLGPLWGALGPFFSVFWTLKIDHFSSMGPRWAPRGFLDGFWMHFDWIWRALGAFWEGFGRVLAGVWDLAKFCADSVSIWKNVALLQQSF